MFIILNKKNIVIIFIITSCASIVYDATYISFVIKIIKKSLYISLSLNFIIIIIIFLYFSEQSLILLV